MDFEEILLYGGIAVAIYIAGLVTRRYHHETDGDAAKARAEGRKEGIETGKQQGIDALAHSLAEVCEEKDIVHTGTDPKTRQKKGYQLRELIAEAEQAIHED